MTKTRRTVVGALVMAWALAATSFAVIAPSPAYADVNRIEIALGGTGLRADVMWGSTNAYQGVFLWPDNGSFSQEYDLLDSGGGFYRIRARHSGQCLMLDWRAGYYTNGTPVIQYPFCGSGYPAAEWSTHPVVWTVCVQGYRCWSYHFVLIKNRATGQCLEANSSTGSPVREAVLQHWDCIASTNQWNARNQMWEFITL